MYKQSSIAVVVPAYNEEGLVGEVIETMPAFVDRVYVIDDASADGTWMEIQRHTERVNDRRTMTAAGADPDSEAFVVPIRNEENGGRGLCVKKGYRRARDAGFDVTAVMDGDGQMDPGELDRIVDPVVTGGAAYAKGTRLRSPSHVDGMSLWRLFGNLLLSLLTNFSSGYWGIADSQNGYTAISLEALETISINDLYNGYGFLNDILTALNVHDFRIAEVPHAAVYAEEESWIQYSTFVPLVSGLLLTNFLYRIKTKYLVEEFHATVICYAGCVLALGAGAIDGLAAVVTGSATIRIVSTLAMFGTGVVLLLLAVMLDMQHNSGLTYQSEPSQPELRSGQ